MVTTELVVAWLCVSIVVCWFLFILVAILVLLQRHVPPLERPGHFPGVAKVLLGRRWLRWRCAVCSLLQRLMAAAATDVVDTVGRVEARVHRIGGRWCGRGSTTQSSIITSVPGICRCCRRTSSGGLAECASDGSGDLIRWWFCWGIDCCWPIRTASEISLRGGSFLVVERGAIKGGMVGMEGNFVVKST